MSESSDVAQPLLLTCCRPFFVNHKRVHNMENIKSYSIYNKKNNIYRITININITIQSKTHCCICRPAWLSSCCCYITSECMAHMLWESPRHHKIIVRVRLFCLPIVLSYFLNFNSKHLPLEKVFSMSFDVLCSRHYSSFRLFLAYWCLNEFWYSIINKATNNWEVILIPCIIKIVSFPCIIC